MRAQKQTKRDLSQINFSSQHWWKQQPWKEQFTNSAKTSIDVQKAALIYEAMRRRQEVQQAWLDGKCLFVVSGFQDFTVWVINNLPLSWPELDEITQGGIIQSMHSPWFIPPRGYSTFPENPERAPGKLKGEKRRQWEAETKERRKVAAKRCQKAALQVLHLPEASESSDRLKAFVEHAQKFLDAGFVIVAVDNKTKQGIRYACEAIEALPRSIRKADLKLERVAYLPSNISDSDKKEMEEKHRQRTFTKQDLDEIWRKYASPTSDPHAPWHKVEGVHSVALHKRERGGNLVEEKLFHFENLCRDLERMDSGRSPKGDFVQRLRL